MYFLPGTPLFMIDGFFEYLVYFGIGAMTARYYGNVREWLREYWWLFMALFIGVFALVYGSSLGYPARKLIIGCMSIPALHALMHLAPFNRSQLLLNWGLLSFAIYLMNTIAIGFAKGITLKFVSWDGMNFLLVGPMLVLVGMYVPILAKRLVFPYIPPLDRITN